MRFGTRIADLAESTSALNSQVSDLSPDVRETLAAVRTACFIVSTVAAAGLVLLILADLARASSVKRF